MATKTLGERIGKLGVQSAKRHIQDITTPARWGLEAARKTGQLVGDIATGAGRELGITAKPITSQPSVAPSSTARQPTAPKQAWSPSVVNPAQSGYGLTNLPNVPVAPAVPLTRTAGPAFSEDQFSVLRPAQTVYKTQAPIYEGVAGGGVVNTGRTQTVTSEQPVVSGLTFKRVAAGMGTHGENKDMVLQPFAQKAPIGIEAARAKGLIYNPDAAQEEANRITGQQMTIANRRAILQGDMDSAAQMTSPAAINLRRQMGVQTQAGLRGTRMGDVRNAQLESQWADAAEAALTGAMSPKQYEAYKRQQDQRRMEKVADFQSSDPFLRGEQAGRTAIGVEEAKARGEIGKQGTIAEQAELERASRERVAGGRQKTSNDLLHEFITELSKAGLTPEEQQAQLELYRKEMGITAPTASTSTTQPEASVVRVKGPSGQVVAMNADVAKKYLSRSGYAIVQ